MNSWREQMPDWEIKEWNEDNFDINYNTFTKQSYEAKKYAFTSDVIRLWALYNYGGIYLDVDVFMYRPLYGFNNFTGFESEGFPVCATMGAEKGNPIIKEFLDYYNEKEFDMKTNTIIMSEILEKHGIDRYKNEIQKIDNFTVYPKEYFNDEKGYTKHFMTRLLDLTKCRWGDVRKMYEIQMQGMSRKVRVRQKIREATNIQTI